MEKDTRGERYREKWASTKDTIVECITSQLVDRMIRLGAETREGDTRNPQPVPFRQTDAADRGGK